LRENAHHSDSCEVFISCVLWHDAEPAALHTGAVRIVAENGLRDSVGMNAKEAIRGKNIGSDEKASTAARKEGTPVIR